MRVYFQHSNIIDLTKTFHVPLLWLIVENIMGESNGIRGDDGYNSSVKALETANDNSFNSISSVQCAKEDVASTSSNDLVLEDTIKRIGQIMGMHSDVLPVIAKSSTKGLSFSANSTPTRLVGGFTFLDSEEGLLTYFAKRMINGLSHLNNANNRAMKRGILCDLLRKEQITLSDEGQQCAMKIFHKISIVGWSLKMLSMMLLVLRLLFKMGFLLVFSMVLIRV